MNRRGPGRKRCCHTEALHAGYYVYFSHGLSRRSRSFHTSFLFVPNYRICELVSSHGRSRMVTVLLSRDLSFGLTDQREVICELSFFSSHGESRRVTGFCHELSYFFLHTESHGESRDLCHELSNCRISFHTESHGGFLCHETCSLSRICELVFFTRNVTDGRGGYEGGTIEA